MPRVALLLSVPLVVALASCSSSGASTSEPPAASPSPTATATESATSPAPTAAAYVRARRVRRTGDDRPDVVGVVHLRCLGRRHLRAVRLQADLRRGQPGQ